MSSTAKVELILVPVMSTAILGAAIGEHPVDPDSCSSKKGDHPIVGMSAAMSGVLRVYSLAKPIFE